MTMQEPENPPFADADVPETEVIVLAPPAPVFVDSTGRRRRLLRRIAYGFGALCMVYGGLISVSLAGGPVSSSAVLPLPDFTGGEDKDDVVVARPTPTPVPTSTRASKQPILEVFPRRAAPVTRRTTEQAGVPQSAATTPRRSATPMPRPTRQPTPSPTSKPAESGTTKPTVPDSTGPSTETPAPVPPAPPAMPPTGGGGGGAPAEQGEDTDPVAAPAVPLPAVPPPATSEPDPATPDEPETVAPDEEPETVAEAAAEPDPEPSGAAV